MNLLKLFNMRRNNIINFFEYQKKLKKCRNKKLLGVVIFIALQVLIFFIGKNQ
jgi:hypothetical protein